MKPSGWYDRAVFDRRGRRLVVSLDVVLAAAVVNALLIEPPSFGEMVDFGE